jgi:phosphomannomutase
MNYDTKSKVPYCCSFDGDADRLIFHYFDKKKRWHMLDGDKITCLLTDFVQTCLKESGLTDISFAAIQNSYANGASTAFLRERGVEEKFDFQKKIKIGHVLDAKCNISFGNRNFFLARG